MGYGVKDFHYYFAVDRADYRKFGHLLQGGDILVSYVYLREAADKKGEFLADVKAHKGRVMLDSGGFTNFFTPGSVKFKDWADFVKSNQSWLDEVVQFDDLKSRRKTLDFYDEAIKLGLDPLFVDHLRFHTEKDRAGKIWKAKPKVCIAGFGKAKPDQDKKSPVYDAKRLHEAFVQGREVKTVVHMLGVGSIKKFLPWLDVIHSVDSASWDKAAAFGKVLVLQAEDLGDGIKIPILKNYTYPGNPRRTDHPIPREQMDADWNGPVKRLKLDKWSVTQRAKGVTIYHMKRYVEAVRKLDPVKLTKQLEELRAAKAEAGSTSYFFLGDDFWYEPDPTPVAKDDGEQLDRGEVMGHLEQAGSFVVVPGFVSLVGSTLTGQDGDPAKDVDLLVRADEVDPKVAVKLERLFPPEMQGKVHVVGDAQGPNWKHLPLYDLVARKREKLVAVEVDEPDYQPFPTQPGAGRPNLTKVVKQGTDLDPAETELTREEARELTEAVQGDPYQVEQKGKRKYRFVLQHHYRGFWSEDERKQIRSMLRQAQAAAKAGDTKKAEGLLNGVWSDFKPVRLKSDIDAVKTAAQAAEDASDGNVGAAVRRNLTSDVPGLDKLAGVEGSIVNLGNVHTDLRMESPAGKWLVGWTLDTPKVALQTLDGKAHNLLRCKVMDNREGDNIVAQRKLVQPVSWLTIVSKEKPVVTTAPGEAGSTAGTTGEFHYVDSGEVIFGVQKTDFHEYFLFPKSGKWGGRWGIQIVEGKPDYEKAPGEFWMANRPAKTQEPYIQTHDRKKEEAKAKEDGVDVVWNPDTVPALRAAGYKPLKDEVKKDADDVVRVALQVPIAKVAKEERYVMGIVMVPEATDAHGEKATAKEIREAAHKFLVSGAKIGYQHQEIPGGLVLLESYLAPVEFKLGNKTIPKGTWLMAVRVNNDEVWKEVKAGRITGFSIEGYAKKVPLKPKPKES